MKRKKANAQASMEAASKKKSLSYLMADDQDESVVDKKSVGELRSFIRLMKFARPYWWQIASSLSMFLISTICAIISAKFMGNLAEEGLLAKNMEKSVIFAVAIVALETSYLLIYWQARRMLSYFSSKIIYDIRASLFEHLQNLPLSYYDRQPQGRIVVRVTHDVEGMEEFFTHSMGRLLNAVFMATISMTAMIITDLRIGATLVASMIPALIFIYLTRNMVRKANREMSRLSSAINSKLAEFINGLEVIRSFGLEKWSKKEYDKAVDEHLDSHLHANFIFGWTRPTVSFFCSLPLVGLVWFGGLDVLAGAMSVGLFVTFVRYLDRFTQPILTLAHEVHVIQQAFTSAERIATFLAESTEESILGEDGKIDNIGHIHGELRFENVSMAYQGEDWILKNVNFHLLPGEKVGLVGRTGCGKTTTVSLISRLYEYQKGEIYLDGRSIRDYSRSYLRSQIGFVSQDAVIFKGSLKENLTTDPTVTISEIENACRETGLMKVMRDSDMTLESGILDAGANLSVGERQLVALTRVLLNNPAILILDEATANIDPKFEKIIHEAVNKLMQNRSCMIIAHRLATLEHCDRIMVFDDGELVEEGKKDELYARRGHFFSLHNAGEKNSGTID